ncbi:MAG: diguanylate cyclase [Anaerosomatales bacterium]|nr:diguanylate cyclase [Anaerosomatales bacterium]
MDAEATAAQRPEARTASVRPIAPLVALWLLLAGTYLVLSVSAPDQRLEPVRQAAYLLPFWAAGISSVLIALKAAAHERRLLRALAAAIVLVATSETLVSARVVLGARIESGWPVAAEVLTVAAAVMMIAALARAADLRAYSTLARVRHGIDAVGVALSVVAVVLVLVVVPLSREGVFTCAQGVAAAAYSGLGALLLISVAANFGLDVASSPEPWFRRVLGGLWVYALATTLWPAWLYGTMVRQTSAWDAAIEVAWMSGMSLAFAGMLARLHEGVRPSASVLPLPQRMPRSHVAVAAAIPLGLTASVVFSIAAGATSVPDGYRGPLFVLGGAIAAVVAVRQALAVLENRRLLTMLSTDPVTGLLAYRPFQDALQTELDIADRNGGTVALVMFDIDGFRGLNEECGHEAGDAALKAAGDAIACAVRSSDVVGRLGGDEFAVIMGGASLENAERFVVRALSEIRAVKGPSGAPLQATAGIALYPVHAGGRGELMRCAAGSLFWAKRHDRGGFAVYDPKVITALDAKDEIEQLEVETQVRAVRALAVAVDARDAATQFHSKNVALLATELGRELGLPHEHVRRLEIAALLHDVGKIGVSDRVLRKRGPLTAAEVMHVREHSVLGERIVRSSGFDDIAPWVRHHHERYDGTGYPDGLRGEGIPFEARLLAVCDAFDAMTSERPYRFAMSPSAALHEIDCCIGSQFDPEIAEAFIALMGRKTPM